MRTLSAVLCLALAGAPLAQAAPVDDAVAKAHEFVEAFDKGDIKAAEATHEADAAIIDDVGGHQLHGPGAFQAWAAALAQDALSGGLTDESVRLGKTIRAEVDGDTAYAVIEATLTYKAHGVAMTEPAQMVFALKKEADGWKIAAWAWSGAAPHKA